MPSIENLSALKVDENNELQIIDMLESPTAKLFQKAVGLSFSISQSAKKIIVDSAELQGFFKHLDYSAFSEEALSINQQGSALLVDLGALRELRSVALKSAYTNHCLEVYRLDGSVLSSKPTVSVNFSGDTVFLPEGEGAYKDTRFALRLRDCSLGEEGYLSLNGQNINDIIIRSFPTGPRLGIGALPGMGSPAVFFRQVPGEINSENAGLGNVNEGQALAKALETYLNDTIEQLKAGGNPMPTVVDATLFVESDTPCVFCATSFHITYRPVLKPQLSFGRLNGRLSDGKDDIKENGNVVLRYLGKQISQKEIIVTIPKNALIIDATVRTTQSFHQGGLLSEDDNCELAVSINQRNTGVYLEAAEWAGQSVKIEKTTSVGGIALGILSLSDKTELIVELQEEWNGRPSGRTVAEGTIKLEGSKNRSWLRLKFAKPVTVTAETHCVLVTAATGKAVWLSTVGDLPLRIFEKTGDKSALKEFNKIDNNSALCRFFSADSNENAQLV
jgi:hypothetical protein